ncbi:MAG TPA: cobyrinate a,c-diamide synthase [Acidimicrobiales bacterium]
MSDRLGPRIVVAGTASGVGTTTVATGIMAALAHRGRRVGAAKVGPDYIDPGYHSLAVGRPGRNLDPWMCGEGVVAGLAARAGAGCDLLVIEGVMGLFDGAGADAEPEAAPEAAPMRMASSTAHVAVLLDAPVILVVDASSMSGSVAAMVHGYLTFDPAVRVSGVILNRVASDSHEVMLRHALAPLPVPVLGVLRRDPELRWRDRHLGLVPVVERPEEVGRALTRLAQAVAAGCDLEGIERVARSAAARPTAPLPRARPRPGARVPVAVASGPAFSFAYPDNGEALVEAGAELVPFDPLSDQHLPPGTVGLVAGGGFPEVFASELARNRPLLADVRDRLAAGVVTWAECGGLLWLSRSLDGAPMAGVLPCDARMTDALTLGYRSGAVRVDSPLGPAGTPVRGHEFHYSAVSPAGEAVATSGRSGPARGGFAGATLVASYLHVHLGGAPQLAERFVAAAAR